jgi:hypothetical protein
MPAVTGFPAHGQKRKVEKKQKNIMKGESLATRSLLRNGNDDSLPFFCFTKKVFD